MAKIRDELLDELLKDRGNPEEFWGDKGLLAELKKRLIERVLNAELDEELGYTKHEAKGKNSGNSRNGHGQKKIFAGTDQIEIHPPRDRNGTFNPTLIPKGQRRFDGFDEKILAMYARGMSVRDMQSMLHELYSVDVSEGFISTVTDAVLEDVKAWQSRALSPIYPIVFLDGIVVKSREDGPVRNKTVYLALGIDMDGQKELLGMWIAPNEGAKFWLRVITELKNRGLEDIFIACVDGLKGFPEAIESVYPETEVQLCIVHMIRNSVRYVNWKDRKALCADLKRIYAALTVEDAEIGLNVLSEKWDEKYPTVSQIWRRNWPQITPYFDYPADIRKAIYTTNAIESTNRSLRKILKTKGAFPNDESIFKLMYLALDKISKRWTMPIRNWKAALNQFAVKFEGRFPI